MWPFILIGLSIGLPLFLLRCFDSFTNTNTRIGAFVSAYQKTHPPVRGYIQMFGTLITIIGLFMPYVRLLFIKLSFFDAMREVNALLPIAIFAVLILIFLLFGLSHCTIAWILSIICAVLHVTSVFSDVTWEEISQVADIGLWVMWLGLLVMVLSPLWNGLNHKLQRAVSGKAG